ncbi:hypothetical protein FGG08_000255 [Glutinoglossum americanum]|uniref:Uncharacterized protein n=1 Tax=Glutinoglossum americanum TaxID=1670608 RepID=A0A9P8L3X7_9PEZI|nr:hypothetical protein FGG08_000255 [Glutinoglossum americanum]
MEGYVFNLRRHIRQGRQVDSATCEHRHLDGLQFWKEQYDTLKCSEMELKKKVYALEKQNESLVEQIRALSQISEHPRKRRRKSDAEGIGQISGSRQHSGLGTAEVFETAFSTFSPIADVVPLIFHTQCLRRLMKSSNSDTSELSKTLIYASSAMAKVLYSIHAMIQGRKDQALAANTCRFRGANRIGPLTQEMKGQQIGEVFKSFFKVFKYLLKGLDIVASSEESSPQGNVIYSFVKLFADMMDCLSFKPMMECGPKRDLSVPAPKKTEDGAGAGGNPLLVTPHTEEIRVQLSKLLISMVGVLDPTRKGHAELYEGFHFVLFTRLGQKVSYFVFGEELANSSLDGLIKDSAKGKNLSEEQDEGSRQEEAWYLIWLLERVMGDLYDSNPACKLLGRTSDTPKGHECQSLLNEAKARIRSTFLRGIFGEDAEEFDGLKMPALSNGGRNDPVDNYWEESGSRICTPGFFVQEIWRLIGWQILAGEDLF